MDLENSHTNPSQSDLSNQIHGFVSHLNHQPTQKFLISSCQSYSSGRYEVLALHLFSSKSQSFATGSFLQSITIQSITRLRSDEAFLSRRGLRPYTKILPSQSHEGFALQLTPPTKPSTSLLYPLLPCYITLLTSWQSIS